MPLSWPLRRPIAVALLSAALAGASAAPYLPELDSQVLERLPSRSNDPVARELAELRTRWRRNPIDLQVAVDLARRYFEQAGVDGDPRYVGYAQAALEPWWGQPDPPVPARVMRAVVLQYSHRFDEAVADLDAAVRAEPDEADAWAWLAAIHTVRADYSRARRACEQLMVLAESLVGTGCTATVDSLTGRAATAATALRQALRDDREADPGQRLWALTRLAEIEEHRGATAAAEAAYREALALGQRDVYLLAAYADFLLDRGRPAEVLALLKDLSRADVLLLRLALAAKAAGDPRLAAWTRELEARFDATRARGDTTHRKEEARFAWSVLGQADRALVLARDNYAQQREVADARILLEAAWAARQRDAAQPVLQWMTRWQVEDPALQSLADRWEPNR
jgi:predicted Zn-dependent protease